MKIFILINKIFDKVFIFENMKEEKTDKSLTLVFVYGTLKKGFYNHANRLDGSAGYAKFIKNDWVNGQLYDLGVFPAAVLNYNADLDGSNESEITQLQTPTAMPPQKIFGEVYEIDMNVLQKLDRLEGYPAYYNRSKVKTRSGLEVWIYHMDSDSVQGNPIIESGIWE